MRRREEEDITVSIDSREQLPYWFPRSVRATLPTGDYSIAGLEDRVAIERKSLADAYSSLSQGRERFERELERLAELEYAAIVIESSLSGFLIPPEHSQMNPRSAIASVLAWSVKYSVPVFFTDDRLHGNATTLRLLQYFSRYYVEATPWKRTRSLSN